ncbi:MAG: sensor histidine kinase [Gelidibacter sp.]
MKLFCKYLIATMGLLPFFCVAQQSKIDSLKSVIASGKQDSETAKAMNFLSYEFVRTDVEKATYYLWKAKYLGKKIKDDRTLSSTYSHLTSIHQNQGQMDSALVYLDALKELSDRASGEDANVIKANYFSTAGLYHKKSGNLKEALPFFISSYELIKKTGNIEGASGQSINIGNSYLSLSNFNMALEYYLKALQGFEKIGNKKGLSFCYQNIGECYIELKQFEAAQDYIKKSIALKTEMKDKRGLGNAEQSLGRIYTGLENYDAALKHFNSALELSKEMNLSTEEVKIHFNLGKIFAIKNDNLKAIAHFENAKALAQNLGDSNSVIAANLELLAIKETGTAQVDVEKIALENINILKETGAVSKAAAGYRSLADYFTNQKQFDKALEYTNLYNVLNDSIRNNEVQTQFKNIEEAYFKEKNEKQIALLQKKEEISAQKIEQQRLMMAIFGIVILFSLFGLWNWVHKNRLRQQMKELELRNQIASDLHDEVGSSLSSIYMLSQMAVQDSIENKKDILKKVSDNAHETMDKMSDIVWMLKPSEKYGSQLNERMERFVHDICSSNQMAYTFSACEFNRLKLTTEQSKNLYLIFKEAVNNAIKYSRSKTLDVRIDTLNNHLEMNITDQGCGFDETSIEKGNGLDNMKKRAAELKGKLTIDSQPNKGTQVSLRFPIS